MTSVFGAGGTQKQITQIQERQKGNLKNSLTSNPTSNSDKRKKMQQIKDVMKKSEGGVAQKKESLVSNLKTQENNQEIDSGSALQLFLDNILISSIPGIKNSPGKHHIISNVPLSLFLVCFLNLVTLKSHYENNVFLIFSVIKWMQCKVLELKTGDSVRDAIHLMHEKNVCGAPITDNTKGSFSDPYIGFIDFASIVLWFFEVRMFICVDFNVLKATPDEHLCSVIYTIIYITNASHENFISRNVRIAEETLELKKLATMVFLTCLNSILTLAKQRFLFFIFCPFR